MKHISILVLQDVTLASLDGARQLFDRVNDLLKFSGRPPFYKVELVAETNETRLNNGSYTIFADKILPELKHTDLIVIPILCGDFKKIIHKNKMYIDWLVNQYKNGAEVASLCAGSYFLASTGLLNGQKCAIHWAVANEFNNMFPEVKTVDDKIMTDNNGIYTSGGNYSYLNLILYIIEKQVGRDVAVLASKMFEIDIERKSQAPYIIFMGQKEHDDEPIKKAQEFIEKNYHDKITVEQLTNESFLGRRNFERRFKKATSNTVIEYLQRIRTEAVKKGLETSRKSIIDLMHEVGYSDMKAFRVIFKKYTGMSPLSYRNKYSLYKAA
jgi:transcriptional regulator GlxA family with amidase domain